MGDEKFIILKADNAIDFLLRSAQCSVSSNETDWKYSIIHLCSAIELLFKLRLEEEHWTLVFNDINKASKFALTSGDFISVDLETSIDRLKNICEIEFVKDDLYHIRELKKIRNKIEHFEINFKKDAIRSILAITFDIAINFIENELEFHPINREQKKQEALKQLSYFKEFVVKRMELVNIEINNIDKTIRDCPKCWQDTLVLGDGFPRCLFCGFSDDPEKIIDQIIKEDFDECPKCLGMMVQEFVDSTGSRWCCYSCGSVEIYEICELCQGLFVDNDGLYICKDCLEKRVEKDST